jgi:hypothetical protein
MPAGGVMLPAGFFIHPATLVLPKSNKNTPSHYPVHKKTHLQYFVFYIICVVMKKLM